MQNLPNGISGTRSADIQSSVLVLNSLCLGPVLKGGFDAFRILGTVRGKNDDLEHFFSMCFGRS